MTCEACKTIPPVVVNNYLTKGTWASISGLKTYITGSPNSKKAIIDIYDVFGLASQTLQGADLLAAATGAVVFVPDFLHGEVAREEWFTSKDPVHEEAKKKFFGILGLEENVGKLRGFLEGIAVLASGPGTSLKVSGQVHPGRLEADDAKKIVIPHIVLASNGEDEKVVAEYKEILVGEGKPHVVETYANMHHGWMGARAKLDDAENLKEYERGYNELAAFFDKYL
ncbi:hypothetical protein EG329_002934 [Mollisiaceae sp. DMI_Dod_QoI]|nr:hypothetical protein EG329_002934 [Helotiales sp. DMI_Dod_QoI]